MRSASLLSVFAFVACSSEPQIAPPDGGLIENRDAESSPDAEPAIVFYRDVKPIVDAKCVVCHLPGGIGPLDLTDPEVVMQQALLIAAEINNGKMPPWPPGQECRSAGYLHDRSLNEAQKQTVVDWAVAGAPRGDPAKEGAALQKDVGGLTRVDQTLRISAMYEPRAGDDYHCFILEWPETEQKFVTGFNIVPTEPRILHHVNIYSTDAVAADHFREKDANALGLGYPCFGGAATEAGVALVGAWAPGSLGIEYPAGTGLGLDPGSVIVLEAHYSVPVAEGLRDQLALDLQIETTVEKRAIILAFWDFVKWGHEGHMEIPANEADVMHNIELDPNGGVQIVAPWIRGNNLLIYGAGLHMHYLGSRAELSVRHGTGDAAPKSCLISIPDWDFNWQSGYLFAEPEPFHVGTDTAYLECHWDNTQANQPVINGVQRPVQDVNWGGGSTDEMCIGYAYIVEE